MNVLVTITRKVPARDEHGNIVGEQLVENTRIYGLTEEDALINIRAFVKTFHANKCTLTFETED